MPGVSQLQPLALFSSPRITIDNTVLYAIFGGTVLALLVVISLFRLLTFLVRKHVRVDFLRHLYYPHLPWWICDSLGLSIYTAILILLAWWFIPRLRQLH